ncbi:uncharacterized protein LOC110243711 [Exaiptasia diaphana]|uniref:Uncharacterized protein n=1 Tax=Exaiptasia diaphana TaxID=2652724 RepID=A0A913XJZ0_EXADI|nr:uncharacterized protein LOC110243711 [Exaiptasia diaphana]
MNLVSFYLLAAMETKIQGSQKETIIIIVVTVAGAIVLVLVLGYLLYSRHLRKKKSDQDQNADLPVIEPPDVRPPYVYPDNNPMREEYTQVDNPDQVPLIMDTF